MGMTLDNIRDLIVNLTGLGDTEDSTDLTRLINIAYRDVWVAYPWSERWKEAYVATVEPYQTGTVTLTNGATTCTGSGTTFPASFAASSRKIARGLSYPAYVVSYVSATSLTLARNYLEDTASGLSYILYADEYDIASDVDAIRAIRLHTTSRPRVLRATSRMQFDADHFLPDASGTPEEWCQVTDVTAGTFRIRVWPVPDDVYAMQVLYLKSITELSGDSDEPLLRESLRDIITEFALGSAYRLSSEPEKAGDATVRANDLLQKAIEREQRVQSRSWRMQPFDADRSGGRVYIDWQT